MDQPCGAVLFHLLCGPYQRNQQSVHCARNLPSFRKHARQAVRRPIPRRAPLRATDRASTPDAARPPTAVVLGDWNLRFGSLRGDSRGFRPGSLQPQGLQPQGLQPQGLQPQGLQPRGLQARGSSASRPSTPRPSTPRPSTPRPSTPLGSGRRTGRQELSGATAPESRPSGATDLPDDADASDASYATDLRIEPCSSTVDLLARPNRHSGFTPRAMAPQGDVRNISGSTPPTRRTALFRATFLDRSSSPSRGRPGLLERTGCNTLPCSGFRGRRQAASAALSFLSELCHTARLATRWAPRSCGPTAS